ncbi:MAG: carboxypeptidase M32 [Oscillospiraceae bacterium]|nr:carboxypeptidase M32 [Oscillospiraceae bacterium]
MMKGDFESMTNRQKWKALSKRLDEIEAYGRCIGKVGFDMECCAPEEGIERAGEDMALVGKRLYALSHAKGFEKLICALHEDSEGLTPVQKKAVGHLYDDYARVKNISAKLDYEMDLASNRAYGAWLKAKKADDFSLFRDSLGELIRYQRLTVELRDEKKATVYDTCLDDKEKGGSIEQLDAFFAALRTRIVPLLRRVTEEGKPIREDFVSRPVPIPRQEAMSRYLLELEGLRQSALVLMTTEHPFTDNYGRNDVRVTTHYHEECFLSNVFTTLHEGGHALFMQNEPQEFFDEHCAERMSNAMHETISRFYENLIGRSEAFISLVAPQIRALSGGVFDDVSDRELYEAVNVARPSLIRTEADELSYCLHIMVRYELEKAFVNGEITVDEIPALWKAKYKEYLGVEVPDDAQGCLQDVHWSSVYFGYFPSYALGNAYGVQILRVMEKDFDVFAAVRAGDLVKIRDWLTARVFSIASISTPDEWIRTITGESLNPDYYLDYLEEKFTKLYELR